MRIFGISLINENFIFYNCFIIISLVMNLLFSFSNIAFIVKNTYFFTKFYGYKLYFFLLFACIACINNYFIKNKK